MEEWRMAAELGRQAVWREHVDCNVEQLRKFHLDPGNVHHRGLFGRVHQQIEIAVIGVVTMHD
jgi:hypothetical protein